MSSNTYSKEPLQPGKKIAILMVTVGGAKLHNRLESQTLTFNLLLRLRPQSSGVAGLFPPGL